MICQLPREGNLEFVGVGAVEGMFDREGVTSGGFHGSLHPQVGEGAETSWFVGGGEDQSSTFGSDQGTCSHRRPGLG